MSDRWDVPWKKDSVEQRWYERAVKPRQSARDAACGEVRVTNDNVSVKEVSAPHMANDAPIDTRDAILEDVDGALGAIEPHPLPRADMRRAVVGWLDRQREATKRQAREAIRMEYALKLEAANASWQARVDELDAQRADLARRLMASERDRDYYRRALGEAKERAHEIERL